MHELSIALDLVELARETSTRLGVPRVIAVHVRIGPLAGVVEHALMFSFGVAAAGTPIEGAALVVEHVPLVVFCEACGVEQTLANPQHLRCPACGAFTPEVRTGRELQVSALEVPDVPDRADSPEHPQEERSDCR